MACKYALLVWTIAVSDSPVTLISSVILSISFSVSVRKLSTASCFISSSSVPRSICWFNNNDLSVHSSSVSVAFFVLVIRPITPALPVTIAALPLRSSALRFAKFFVPSLISLAAINFWYFCAAGPISSKVDRNFLASSANSFIASPVPVKALYRNCPAIAPKAINAPTTAPPGPKTEASCGPCCPKIVKALVPICA